jgi:hypothetical protein
VDKATVASVNTDMANVVSFQAKKNQITRRESIKPYRSSVPILIRRRPRHIDSELLIGEVN